MTSDNRNKDLSKETKAAESSASMSQPPPTLPNATAPPEEVRLFITHLLQEQGAPQNDARDVAARWKIGRGREMRSYDPSIYFEVFGAEYGWILYRDIKLRVHEEEGRKFTSKYGTKLITVGLAAFTASMVYICFCDVSDLILGLAIYAAIVGALALCIWVVAILVMGTTEESIESELRDCRKNYGGKKD